MNRQSVLILALALLALFPQGVTNQIYGTGAAEMAGVLGLSLDEATWIRTLNMVGQLIALPMAAWLAYRIGLRNLFRLGAAIGLLSALSSSLVMTPLPQLVAWVGHGISASFLLLCAHAMVMRNLDYRAIALVEALVLLSAVLIPLGLYPYLLSHLADNQLWHWSFAVQVAPFLGMLYWGRFGPWPDKDTRQKIGFNFSQALLLSAFIGGVTYLLLRGERFNWFRDPEIVQLTLLTLVVGVALVWATRRKIGRGEFIRTNVMADRHGKVGMLDAAVAGFVILGTSLLTSFYVTQVLGYNKAQLGKLELIGFIGMLGGLLVAVFMTSNPKRDPEKVIPLGVAMMVVACMLLAGSNAHSGMSDMWPALLLKGCAVGILNVTLTIHIFRSFPKHQIVEGIAWFFLFRNLGSLIAITEFSRLLTIETTHTVNTLADNYSPSSPMFNQYQQLVMQALGQGGASSGAEQSAGVLGGLLQTQAMSVAGVNSFQWIIFSIAMLVPVMVGAMKWANNQSHQEKAH